MANRFFSNISFSLEKAPVRLYAKVAIGATGAPTLSVTNSKGIASITRQSAGDYVIVLQDKYNKLLSLDSVTQNATGISASPSIGIKAVSLSAASPSIEIVFATGSTATDPASGDTLYLEIILSNSTAV